MLSLNYMLLNLFFQIIFHKTSLGVDTDVKLVLRFHCVIVLVFRPFRSPV